MKPRQARAIDLTSFVPLCPETQAQRFSLGVRLDLRTGMVAAGIVRTFDAALAPAQILHAALQVWRAAGMRAPLSLSIAAPLSCAAAREFVDAVRALKLDPRFLTLELNEPDAARAGLEGVQELRLRGFGVALRLDAEKPLPLDEQARRLFTDFLFPRTSDPRNTYMGEAWRDCPWAGRLFLARERHIRAIVLDVQDRADAKLMSDLGFDCAEGPYTLAPQPAARAARSPKASSFSRR